MPHEDQPQQKLDKASEGDRKSETSAKVAGESVTDDPQAQRYEKNFTSFSSSRGQAADATSSADVDPDDPLAHLMARVNSYNQGANGGGAVSEFVLEDKAKGKLITARGERDAHEPRTSFIDGLKQIFDRTNNPEEVAELQRAFSIEYILRKAKELVGTAIDALSPHSSHNGDASRTSESGAMGVDGEALGARKETAPKTGLVATAREGLFPDEISRPTQIAVINLVEQEQKPYAGESSLQGLNIPASAHRVKPGETLASIACEHLSPHNASQANCDAYMIELRQINGLKGTEEVVSGKELVLPGHGKDAAFIVKSGGMTVITFPSGEQHFDNKNGRSFVRTPNEDGGYVEKHTGPGALDNYSLVRTREGNFIVSEQDGSTSEVKASDSIAAKHAELHELAKAIPDPGARTKFEADMVRFEDRARHRGISDKEVIDTYTQVERLLQASTTKVPYWTRFQLAEEVMDHLADPRGISQGAYNTCNVTTVESMIYTKQPLQATHLIAEIAINGSFKSDHATKPVTLDETSLQPHEQAYLNRDGKRSFATQLFNVAAVNLVYANESGGLHYVQGKPGGQVWDEDTKKLVTPEDDSGERLYDGGNRPISAEPGLDDDQIVKAYQLITGDTRRGIFIDHANNVSGDGKLVDTISDEDQLKNILHQQKNNFPIIIGVHTANEPFYTDSGGGAAGGSGGGHVVTITGYNEATGQVQIDNQWDSKVDHRSATMVSVHALYMATLEPGDSATELGKDVVANVAAGKVDTAIEFDLMRLQRAGDVVKSDIDYGWELAQRVSEAEARWSQQKKDGTYNANEHDRAMAKLAQLKSFFSEAAEIAFSDGNLSPAERAKRRPIIEAALKAGIKAHKPASDFLPH